MPKKQKTNDPINDIIKKVKSTFLDLIVREWLNTPQKNLGGYTPLQAIKKGDGQKILDALKQSEEELKKERIANETGNRSVEKSIE
jgi:hypothetical protein